MPRSFCRTLGVHCCCSYSEKFSFQCRFRLLVSITCRQCAWRVARGFFSLASTPARALGVFPASVAPLAARAGVSCGGRDPVTAVRGQERRLNAVPRRPSPPGSPRGLMHASARPCTATATGKHRTRSLPPTGPRRPVLSNSLLSLQLD